MFNTTYLKNRAEEAQARLEYLARSGDLNAQLHHNLTEAHVLEYETAPQRRMRSNAFSNALCSVRSLISSVASLRAAAATAEQQAAVEELYQKLLVVHRQAGEYIAGHTSNSGRAVFEALSMFVGVEAIVPARPAEMNSPLGSGGVGQQGGVDVLPPGVLYLQPANPVYQTNSVPVSNPMQMNSAVGPPTPVMAASPVMAPPVSPVSALPLSVSTAPSPMTAPVPVMTAPVPAATAPVPVMTAPMPVMTAPVPAMTAPVPTVSAPAPPMATEPVAPTAAVVYRTQATETSSIQSTDPAVAPNNSVLGPVAPTTIPAPPGEGSEDRPEPVLVD